MKSKYSNIAVALIFFVVGTGIGIIIGMYHGYNIGYKGGVSDTKLNPDTVVVHDFINYPEDLENE